MALNSKVVQLAARPIGQPKLSDFVIATAPVADPSPGQVLVRNDWISVDPYMRGRMDDVKSYVPPFELGKPMDGCAVGTVVASACEIPVGTVVFHSFGWREHATLDAKQVRAVDTSRAPASEYLGVLGMTGLTAYAGLKLVAPVKPGDIVFVSSAAGAVGLVAGVVARKLGATRVIGSAGAPEKVKRLVERFGYDAAIDYRAGDLAPQLAAKAPDGIDVYFDSVGGEHLQVAIAALRNHGRVALCGAISQYNATGPATGPDNLALAIGKRLSLRGYLVFDHYDLYEEYIEQATEWLKDGSLSNEQTVVDGIDNAPAAFLDMLRGVNTGKMLVRLSEAPTI
jgi:NADPH-dependent curcumin reductase CurA